MDKHGTLIFAYYPGMDEQTGKQGFYNDLCTVVMLNARRIFRAIFIPKDCLSDIEVFIWKTTFVKFRKYLLNGGIIDYTRIWNNQGCEFGIGLLWKFSQGMKQSKHLKEFKFPVTSFCWRLLIQVVKNKKIQDDDESPHKMMFTFHFIHFLVHARLTETENILVRAEESKGYFPEMEF